MTTKDKLFIVFEGIDGAGTTTQAKLLAERMQKERLSVWQTAEPTQSAIGRMLRKYLRREIVPLPDWTTMALLFSSDRCDHYYTKIFQTLSGWEHVVCDRYIWSTMAYQATTAALRVSEDYWGDIVERVVGWISELNKMVGRPHITFYLDVPVEEAQRRLVEAGRGNVQEVYEYTEMQKGVAKVYKQLPMLDKKSAERTVFTIDGTKSKEEIAEECWQKVEHFLKGEG